MTDKELQWLNRRELLEIMKLQAEKIEDLEAEVRALREQLEDRTIVMEQSGSLAEACLKLNRIFEAAQEAADQYLYNVKKNESIKTRREHGMFPNSDEKDECQKRQQKRVTQYQNRQ